MLKIFKYLICITLAGAASVVIAISGTYLYLAPDLPRVDILNDIRLKVPLRIYSADNQLIGEFGEQRRTPIAYNDVPQELIYAFISAEDSQFFEHSGISVTGFARAVLQMLTGSNTQTGGSTITMQVAKNYFLSPDRNVIRKIREMFLAIQIEQQLSKEQIFELYVNKIFLGHRAYGIVAAAQVYYGKPINELTLEQFATIAGIPKAPSAYNPIANPPRALIRRDWILSRMLKLGYISSEHYQDAIAQPITASKHEIAIDVNIPYIAEMARREALALYGESAYEDGLKIYTTVDSQLQIIAEQAVKTGLQAYDNRHGYRKPQVIRNLNLQDEEALKEAFTRVADLANVKAAIVLKAKEQLLEAKLRDGQIVHVDWNSIAKQQPYIDENRMARPVEKVTDIIHPRDVIYLQQDERGLWQLAQIPQIEAALVAINPNNGAIISLVGGYDFYKSRFNRAIQAERQMGSVIKPFVYAAALSQGFTAASIINDAPIVIESSTQENVWRPRNAGAFSGPIRLRQALYLSKNLVSVRILRQIGINNTINYLNNFGFNKEQLPRDLTLALGSASFTPLTVASAYAVFANGGYKIEPYLIKEIRDTEDKIIYQTDPFIVCAENCDNYANDSAESRIAPRVIDEDIVFIIDNILQDTIKRGTATRARVLNRPDLAGKTGTTNGPTDVWFSGYHPNLVSIVWLGLNNNTPLGNNEYGSSSALPIWIEYMQSALKDQPIIDRKQPADVVSVLINRNTGKRAQPGDSDAMFEYIQRDALDNLEFDTNKEHKNTISIEDIFQ